MIVELLNWGKFQTFQKPIADRLLAQLVPTWRNRITMDIGGTQGIDELLNC
jgi:hypothetical protein